MENKLLYVNLVVSIFFSICYFYQILLIPISLLIKKKEPKSAPENNSYAILICARNEAIVIGDLLDSIKAQTYKGKITVFVIADNCIDNTAEIAAAHGAIVYRRFNNKLVGKSYAMEALLNNIKQDFPDGFDGYFVFDADNILESDYVSQVNKVFTNGYDIVTGYRNSKNYGTNWISAGSGLWFLRECRYLHYPRYLIGSDCSVGGTGFIFSRDVAEQIIGWPFHTLTEDIEFSVDQVVKGKRIGFCKDAMLYDEQPVTFSQSWDQRLRWSKGFFQVSNGYALKLLKGIFGGSFSCYDMLMTVLPMGLLSGICLIFSFVNFFAGVLSGGDITSYWSILLVSILSIFPLLIFEGVLTTITEWKNIHTSTPKKLLYMLTFPFFLNIYLPIQFVAMFSEVQWKPIRHTVTGEEFTNSK